MVIDLFKKTYPEIEDVKICKFSIDKKNIEFDEILFEIDFNKISLPRKNIKKGNLVDQHLFNKHLINLKNSIFTSYDLIGKNVINTPLSFTPCDLIQQNKNYYKKQNKNIYYNNNLFWSGNKTHDIREKIIDYLILNKQKNINVNYWKLKPNVGVYDPELNRIDPKEYIDYFNKLQNSDLFLVIRGDIPWTNSFFDCLRANTIPVCIDTFYGNLGWENIGIKCEDLFLDFNTKKESIEEIIHKILNLLKDKEKILYIKNNIKNFYSKYILTDRFLQKFDASYFRLSGWGDFFCAKILEIKRNNYNLSNNKFISKIVKEIKIKQLKI